ncbi:UxaA family hydrolase [Paracoccus mutanolyticus]
MSETTAAPATTAPRIIRLRPQDDVVIATRPIPAGTLLEEEGITTLTDIPPGHKIATHAIAQGQPVRRYNQIIGLASQDIAPGDHIHVHNLAMTDVQMDHAIGADAHPTPRVEQPATFMGYRRPDGRAATRNYIGIISSVNCSARVVRAIADHFRRDIRPESLADFPNVDGVVALTHGIGCAVDSKSESMRIVRRTLSGFATHPNFAAVLFIGLGCETNQIADIMQSRGLTEGAKLKAFPSRTRAAAKDHPARHRAGHRHAARGQCRGARADPGQRTGRGAAMRRLGRLFGDHREPGAGPAVDILVSHGGTAILSETPEIYGAEHLLTRRAETREVGEKLIARIDWWKEHTARNGAEMNNNPSAGNKAGGLTTILEKSLGAVAKAGTTNLRGVYEYAEPVTEHGMVFMDSPGYDPVSATGQVASGANLICFTTGRGSAFGCVPAPSLKFSTNTATWLRQEEDMDLNCGSIIDGGATIEGLGEVIFRMMIDCASGKPSKSEQHGYGQDEFVPWQIGVVT